MKGWSRGRQFKMVTMTLETGGRANQLSACSIDVNACRDVVFYTYTAVSCAPRYGPQNNTYNWVEIRFLQRHPLPSRLFSILAVTC